MILELTRKGTLRNDPEKIAFNPLQVVQVGHTVNLGTWVVYGSDSDLEVVVESYENVVKLWRDALFLWTPRAEL